MSDLPAAAQQQQHAGESGPPLAELLPGLSTAVRTLARAAKKVPEAAEIYYYNNIPEYKQLSSDISSQAQSLLAAAALHLTRPVPAAAAAAAGGGGKHSTASALFASRATAAAAAADSTDADDEDEQDDEAVLARLTSLLDDTYERLDTALDASKASSQALKLGGWAIPQHNRQPLRAAARGLSGSRVAQVAGGGGRIQRHVADLARPQDSFPDAIDNSVDTPCSPNRFPHLAQQLAAVGADGNSSSSSSHSHPYAAELSRLQYAPWQLQKQEAAGGDSGGSAAAAAASGGVDDVLDLDAVPCTLVDTPEGLSAMVDALRGVRQVAIDLEHHSYRSYQGFTCLLQLSTRTHDWVVDTLALRGQLGPALGPLLADPAVEKVLHGADNDVLWLQRDFGLYIVNLFDTGQAARVLAYPSASLAHLLERHVGFEADKRYQLADWRLRPLPDDMLAYARADTHFLLAVSDRLKDELRALGERQPPSWSVELPQHSGATGCLGCVYERSRQLCLQTYSKPTLSPTAHLEAALRWSLALPPRNMAVFGALYAWRDRTARALDESVHYVLPKGALIELSRAMPTTAADVRRLLGKGSGLSGGASMLLSRAEEVAQVIAQGQQQLLQPQLSLQQQDASAAAGGDGLGVAGASASAVVVKPKELPAIVPRKLGAVAVKAAPSAAAGGGGSSSARGLFGKASSSKRTTTQQQVVEPAPPQQPEQPHQQSEQPPQQHEATAPGVGTVSSSGVAAKALPPPRKASSSLGGLFSRKRPATAALGPAATASAGAKPAKTFRVDFLTVQPEENTPEAGGDAAAAAEAVAGQQGDGASDEQQQQQHQQRVTGAEIRAAVDQMAAEDSDAGVEDEDEAAAAAAAGAGDAEEAAGDWAELDYVPLSKQGPKKRLTRRERRQAAAAAAAVAAAATQSADTPPLVQQQAGPGNNKRKGIFAGIDSGSSSSEAESDENMGSALPSFDPNRLGAAAAAAAANNAGGPAAGEDGEEEEERGRGGRRGRGRGRGRVGGGRDRGGRGGRGGAGSLAATRRRQGDSHVGNNMFQVQDGPFKAARRKGGAAGRSKTFK